MALLDVIDVAGLAAEYGIPGAVVGLIVNEETSTRPFGILHTATRVSVTADSLFQIGSVTKLWTATLIMQLADEGVLDIEAPVQQYLPDFSVGADREAVAAMRIRHLLTHQSGLPDDYTPTTRGDDAVARYVADIVPTLTLQFPPGGGFAYSNAGYVVLGRIAETLCRSPYHEALRTRVATPLRLRQWAPIPEDALLFSTAVGHIAVSPDGPLQAAAPWSMSAAHAPAGSQVAMSAASLLAFAGAYLRGGPPLLSRHARQQMWTPEPGIPELGGAGGELAIGGVIQRVGSHTVIAYDGATHGQSASLRILPDAGAAVVSMANGGNMFAFHHDVLSQLTSAVADIALPGPPTPPLNPEPVDTKRLCGRYRGTDLEVDVTAGPHASVLVTEQPLSEELKTLLPGGVPTEYVQLDADTLIGTTPRIGIHPVVTILGDPATQASGIVHFGRTLNRVDAT